MAESQITSPTDQSKPLAEERISLAYLTQPTRGVRTQTPPRLPLLTNQSNFLHGPAASTANEVRSQPNTPSSLASRPRGAPGVCTTGGGKMEKHLPPASGGYRPTRDHPPARSCRRTRRGEALFTATIAAAPANSSSVASLVRHASGGQAC